MAAGPRSCGVSVGVAGTARPPSSPSNGTELRWAAWARWELPSHCGRCRRSSARRCSTTHASPASATMFGFDASVSVLSPPTPLAVEGYDELVVAMPGCRRRGHRRRPASRTFCRLGRPPGPEEGVRECVVAQGRDTSVCLAARRNSIVLHGTTRIARSPCNRGATAPGSVVCQARTASSVACRWSVRIVAARVRWPSPSRTARRVRQPDPRGAGAPTWRTWKRCVWSCRPERPCGTAADWRTRQEREVERPCASRYSSTLRCRAISCWYVAFTAAQRRRPRRLRPDRHRRAQGLRIEQEAQLVELGGLDRVDGRDPLTLGFDDHHALTCKALKGLAERRRRHAPLGGQVLAAQLLAEQVSSCC